MDETIVDKAPKRRAGRGAPREIERPKALESVALDICCGVEHRRLQVDTFFSGFGSN